ncbi:hypothetical protein ACH5RR_033900 [Cinchona calisaya]|uniref:Uncharacterized protein n=1 Tax=Cinchona calisaya TaxID=153742 RepID=A0ABD2Y9B8_9GENT
MHSCMVLVEAFFEEEELRSTRQEVAPEIDLLTCFPAVFITGSTASPRLCTVAPPSIAVFRTFSSTTLRQPSQKLYHHKERVLRWRGQPQGKVHFIGDHRRPTLLDLIFIVNSPPASAKIPKHGSLTGGVARGMNVSTVMPLGRSKLEEPWTVKVR